MLKLTPHRKPAPPVERTGKVYPAEGKRRGPRGAVVRLHQPGACAVDR